MKRIILHLDQIGFILSIQGAFKICKKSVNMILHINKRKTYYILSSQRMRGGGIFDKIQHSFIIEKTQKTGTRTELIQLDK